MLLVHLVGETTAWAVWLASVLMERIRNRRFNCNFEVVHLTSNLEKIIGGHQFKCTLDCGIS